MKNGDRPLFSIVIPTYNRALLLAKAVESIKKQTFKDWEVIIIDDGSTDNTAEVIKPYVTENIRYIYQENAERSIARNHGVAESRGRYICFLDSDDWFLSDHLEKLYQSIEEHDYPRAMFYTGLYFYKDNGLHEHVLPEKMQANRVEHVLFFTIYPTSACLHRDIFNDFLFDDNMLYAEDVGLWVHAATKFPVIQVNHYTSVVNIHSESTTQQYSKLFKIADVEKKLDVFKEKVLFKNEINNHLGRNAINKYISRYYYWFMYESYDRRTVSYMIYFYIKYLFYYPANIFNGNAYKALLDLIHICRLKLLPERQEVQIHAQTDRR